MKRRKSRNVTDEEQELWRHVTRLATPLNKSTVHKLPSEQKASRPKAKPNPARPIDTFDLGQHAPRPTTRHDPAPQITDQVRNAPVRMDRKAFGKMKQGKLVPEGRIDLHGMTLSQAHPTLTRFILASHAQGKRLVLVITGKGKSVQDDGPIPMRRGVLRHQVPSWLSSPPLGAVVLQVAQANIKHGGEGAYYVYLRRER